MSQNFPLMPQTPRGRKVAAGAVLGTVAAIAVGNCQMGDEGGYELPDMELSAPMQITMSGGNSPEKEQSKFAGRLKTLLDALRDQDEAATQHSTAELIKKCGETRTAMPTTCPTIPRDSQNGSPDYQPMEVHCTSSDGDMNPLAMASTYIGPVCYEYEEPEGYGDCLDRRYATIVATGKMAARLRSEAEYDATDIFAGDAGTMNFQDVFHATVRSYAPQTFDDFLVVKEANSIEELVDDWDSACGEMVSALDSPSTEQVVANAQYQSYLEMMDILWDSLRPIDMITAPETTFFTHSSDSNSFEIPIPVQVDEDPESAIFIEVQIPTDDETSPLLSVKTNEYQGWDNSPGCQLTITVADLQNNSYLADDLVDCGLMRGGDWSPQYYFEWPERYGR